MNRTLYDRILISVLVVAVTLPAALHSTSTDGQLSRALDELQALAESRPNDPAGWNDLGNLLSLAGRTDDAEDSYRRALSVAPDHPTALFNLAILLQENHRWDDSAHPLHRLVKLNPTHARAHYHLGIAQSERGKTKRAVESFTLAFRHDPDLMDPRVNSHILDNPLYQRASIEAHRYLRAGADSPREYDNPSQTRKLFESEMGTDEDGTGPVPPTGEDELPVPREPEPDDG
jgi:tetratricopeptide (TPR) repeat protein